MVGLEYFKEIIRTVLLKRGSKKYGTAVHVTNRQCIREDDV